ncbi:PH domain-containing protein [Weeksellaceae bacterium KMM 9713]|uniref:PH domain-containing protein n=1 Tax=Profundicola chukchiensis TaxID=2961959 RepID=A0A9X4MWJ8_9FLAO|nr:PH domain-containing protein [Profundicola chukchiensis]MDG4946191.1 PH domain-containing protein [Profundicola chukchiensis]
MKIYLSKKSNYVKAVTIFSAVLLVSLATLSVLKNETYSLIGGIIISLIMFGIMFYFYSNSLRKVIIDKNEMILKKNIGKIIIPISEIKAIYRLESSNLPMTSGSMGVFGFIGNTMDNSICMVNDRKNMIKVVTTKDEKYIFSVRNPKHLVEHLDLP